MVVESTSRAGLDRRRFLFTVAGVTAAVTMPRAVRAQAWPSKPIRIVSAQAPGSSVDSMARAYGEYFSSALGVPVVVENRPGGVGMIAAEMVAHSPPDGHTFLFTLHSQPAQAPALLKKMPIDPLKDLTPVMAVSPGTGAWVVKSGLPVRSYAEMLDHARKRPVTVGNYGIGSGWQLQVLELAKATGMQLDIITYRGTGPMMVDLAAGQIDSGSGSLVGLSPGLQSGAVRAIAITTGMRSSKLPGVPTFRELGLSGPVFESLVEMNMLLGPAGTPQPVIDRLAQLTHEAVAKSDKVKAVRDLAGAEDTPVSGEGLTRLVATAWPLYRRLTEALGLTVN